MKNDVRKKLAEVFLKALKEEPLTWTKRFTTPYVPQNGVSGNKYKGYNKFYLSHVINAKNYSDHRFYPQSYIFGSPENRSKDWDDPTKIKVIKGEKPVYIETAFFVPVDKDSGLKPISIYEYYQLQGEDKEKYRPIRKDLPVYNAEQLTGVPKLIIKEQDQIVFTGIERHQAIELAAKNMRVVVDERKTCTACYIPSSDSILLPDRNTFDSEDDFAATKLHEMAHATGAAHRLNRDLTCSFGSADYAIEELRAEIASSFMAQEFGFSMDILLENHKAYVQSWAEAIKKDEKILTKAILDAEKIADYIEDKAEINIDKNIYDEWNKKYNFTDEELKRYGMTRAEWERYSKEEEKLISDLAKRLKQPEFTSKINNIEKKQNIKSKESERGIDI